MLENKGIHRHLKNLAYLIWRLPIFHFARAWLKRTHFTMIHYHRMNPANFKEHLEYLYSKYEIISLARLRDKLYNSTEEELPRNSLVITFDDGWRSNYELIPVIEEYNCPITIFLATGLIGTNMRPSSKRIYEKSMLSDDQLPFSNDTDRSKVVDYQHNNSDKMQRVMLSLEEIQNMKNYVDFQSHGVNHHVTTTLPLNILRYELEESKRFIEEKIGNKVYAFAYPYNISDRREAEAIAEAGYQIGRIGGKRLNTLKTNFYQLKSIGIPADCSLEILEKTLEIAKLKTIFF